MHLQWVKKKSVAIDYIDELENKSDDSVGKDDDNIPEFATFAKAPYWEQIRKANRLHLIDDMTASEMREELQSPKKKQSGNKRISHGGIGLTPVLPLRPLKPLGPLGPLRFRGDNGNNLGSLEQLGNAPNLTARQTVDF